MTHSSRRRLGILLLVALLGAGSLLLTLRGATAGAPIARPDIHVHAHDSVDDFADNGATETFVASVRNASPEPARNFSIKISVPSFFPAFITSVVSDAPFGFNATCRALSTIAWRCEVEELPDVVSDLSIEIDLIITLKSVDIEGPIAHGSVIVKAEGPANDDPNGERNKRRFDFRVIN